MRQPLRHLIESMPSAPVGSIAPRLGGGHFQIISSVPSNYVWPDLVRDGKSPQGDSSLVLITAPGAMGKSAAAKAIAARAGMPYVDLARLRVGSGSLTGELSKALGLDAYSGFVNELKAGRAALILDSSDEAQLTSGRENYLAFLEDLAWLLDGATPAQQIIMLGRRDTTDTTLNALSEVGISPPVYQVAPLSYQQACELIDSALDQERPATGRKFTVHRQHPEPFGQFRDALFVDLAQALDPAAPVEGINYWPEVEHFLGYPPVVAALAERLAIDDNPRSALEELRQAPRSGRPQLRGALLRTVLERILDRESGKVRARVGEALALREDDPVRVALYGQDEQTIRLLLLTGTKGLTIDHPAVLDEHDRAAYEKQIASFVLDHPFVANGFFANAVFSDYVRAWAISSSMGQVYTVGRSEFFATLPKAGPFFTHFLHALSADDHGVGEIPEDVVGDALRSYALGAESGTAAFVQHDTKAVLGFGEGDDFRDGRSEPLTFRVTELSGVLVLTSPLARVLVVTDAGVLLRGLSGSLDIGPEVTIIAQAVEFDADTITAVGATSTESGTWNMISAAEASHPAELEVKALPPSCLAISWEQPWHQWAAFVANFSGDRRLPRQIASQVLVCVRRVLTSFSRSMTNDPSVSSDKMDRVIIGGNEVFVATFTALVGMGVVSREGNIYRVNLDQLAKFGVSWSTLRADDPATALQSLVDAVSERPELSPYKAN